MNKYLIAALFALTGIACLNCLPAIGDGTTDAGSIVSVAPAPDTQIFKRTPVIDGVISDGEWDIFYSYSSAGFEASTYTDWDSSKIYFGIKANQPVEAIISLDGNADGWFNGSENYEIRLTHSSDGQLNLSAGRYDSKDAKSPVASPIPALATQAIIAKSSQVNGAYFVEVAVPMECLPGVNIFDGKKIGLLFAIRSETLKADGSAGAWIPAGEVGQTNECTLVSKKIASFKPLDVGFDLRDCKIARGEELLGKFHLTNNGTENVDVKNVVIAGEGRSGEYLSSEKVRFDGISAKRHVSSEIKSVIPLDMPLGSWAIGAEVKTADNRVGGALVSFEIVEAYDLQLNLPTKPVPANAKDVTMSVVVRNNCRHSIRGNVKITMPEGWELWKNAGSKEFAIASQDAITSVTFKAKPPIGASGKIPVKIEVDSEVLKKSIEGSFDLTNIL